MVKEAEEAELQELEKKFKANSIPASINPERYRAYMKRMAKKKEMIMDELKREQSKGQDIVEYLKSNTKLFDPKWKPKDVQNWERTEEKF